MVCSILLDFTAVTWHLQETSQKAKRIQSFQAMDLLTFKTGDCISRWMKKTVCFLFGVTKIRQLICCAPAPFQLVNTLSSLLVPYSSSSDPEHRVVQYSPHYRLAFSLLNEDAAAGGAVMDWNVLSSINCMCKAFSSI